MNIWNQILNWISYGPYSTFDWIIKIYRTPLPTQKKTQKNPKFSGDLEEKVVRNTVSSFGKIQLTMFEIYSKRKMEPDFLSQGHCRNCAVQYIVGYSIIWPHLLCLNNSLPQHQFVFKIIIIIMTSSVWNNLFEIHFVNCSWRKGQYPSRMHQKLVNLLRMHSCPLLFCNSIFVSDSFCNLDNFLFYTIFSVS